MALFQRRYLGKGYEGVVLKASQKRAIKITGKNASYFRNLMKLDKRKEKMEERGIPWDTSAAFENVWRSLEKDMQGSQLYVLRNFARKQFLVLPELVFVNTEGPVCSVMDFVEGFDCFQALNGERSDWIRYCEHADESAFDTVIEASKGLEYLDVRPDNFPRNVMFSITEGRFYFIDPSKKMISPKGYQSWLRGVESLAENSEIVRTKLEAAKKRYQKSFSKAVQPANIRSHPQYSTYKQLLRMP